jgi:hypothetical protein
VRFWRRFLNVQIDALVELSVVPSPYAPSCRLRHGADSAARSACSRSVCTAWGGEAPDEHGPDGFGIRRTAGDGNNLGDLAQLLCRNRDYPLRQVGHNGTTFAVQQASAHLGPSRLSRDEGR